MRHTTDTDRAGEAYRWAALAKPLANRRPGERAWVISRPTRGIGPPLL